VAINKYLLKDFADRFHSVSLAETNYLTEHRYVQVWIIATQWKQSTAGWFYCGAG